MSIQYFPFLSNTIDYTCTFNFIPAALTLPWGSYGLGVNASNASSVPIYLTPLCNGTEQRLMDCEHYQITACNHGQDTALRCFNSGKNNIIIIIVKIIIIIVKIIIIWRSYMYVYVLLYYPIFLLFYF